jgi:hypothetical protein
MKRFKRSNFPESVQLPHGSIRDQGATSASVGFTSSMAEISRRFSVQCIPSPGTIYAAARAIERECDGRTVEFRGIQSGSLLQWRRSHVGRAIRVRQRYLRLLAAEMWRTSSSVSTEEMQELVRKALCQSLPPLTDQGCEPTPWRLRRADGTLWPCAYSYSHGDDHREESRVPMRTMRARVVPTRATSGEPASGRGCRGREAAHLPQVQVGVLGDRKADDHEGRKVMAPALSLLCAGGERVTWRS